MPNTNDKLAAPELAAVEIDGMTRQSFIMKGTLAAGAVYGSRPAACCAAVRSAHPASTPSPRLAVRRPSPVRSVPFG